MKKLALCVGVDKYKYTSKELKGCKNDALEWNSLLTNTFQFQEFNPPLLDEQATIDNVLSKLKDFISVLEEGDTGVFFFSGHGTSVESPSGSGEVDNREEAIYTYDGSIRDDYIRIELDKLNSKANMILIFDCCFSGTITDPMVKRIFPRINDFGDSAIASPLNKIISHKSPKYLPPEDEIIGLQMMNCPLRKRYLSSYLRDNEIVLTASNDKEYAYEDLIGDKYHGILTITTLSLIRDNNEITYKDLFENIRKYLPNSSFEQSPQLWIKKEKLENPVLT